MLQSYPEHKQLQHDACERLPNCCCSSEGQKEKRKITDTPSNHTGVWKVNQLSPHLQRIVEKYRDNFEGLSVADSMGLDGEVTESADEDSGEKGACVYVILNMNILIVSRILFPEKPLIV